MNTTTAPRAASALAPARLPANIPASARTAHFARAAGEVPFRWNPSSVVRRHFFASEGQSDRVGWATRRSSA